MDTREEFLSVWEKFRAKLKGRMLDVDIGSEHALSKITEILEDERDFWKSPYKEGGRWLHTQFLGNPRRLELIRNILEKDMIFIPLTLDFCNLKLFKLARLIAGVLIGYLVWCLSEKALLSDMQFLISGFDISPVVFSVFLGCFIYYLGRPLDEVNEEKNRRRAIDSYLMQLEKYKLSVENILVEL